MEILKELSDVFLILIRVGTVMRVVYSFVMMSSNEDDEKSYKKKIRNVITFYILAELCYVVKDVMFKYYI
jgi:NADH:ubiquinone oxidoreductase subunit 6 (subunit J)